MTRKSAMKKPLLAAGLVAGALAFSGPASASTAPYRNASTLTGDLITKITSGYDHGHLPKPWHGTCTLYSKGADCRFSGYWPSEPVMSASGGCGLPLHATNLDQWGCWYSYQSGKTTHSSYWNMVVYDSGYAWHAHMVSES